MLNPIATHPVTPIRAATMVAVRIGVTGWVGLDRKRRTSWCVAVTGVLSNGEYDDVGSIYVSLLGSAFSYISHRWPC